jgi:hypothetical protein
MTQPAGVTRKRKKLLIRCTGRRVNPLNNKPYGRVCGKEFTSARGYRSRADWIERARAAGWRVSPLQRDNTVIANCPSCTGPK